MARWHQSLLVPSMLFVAACDGGGGRYGSGPGDTPMGICEVVGSGSFVSAAAAPPSTFTNSTQAFDGNLGTYATLEPAASANGTLSGGGISQSAGTVAGIVLERPVGSVSVTISTYMNNAPSNSSQAASYNFTASGSQGTCPGMNCDIDGPLIFFGIDTTLDFDEIEAAISISNLSEPLRIVELCIR